ncbi:hypothetical protein [Clostridium faecium]|uniref:Uncharacterized protein n=1 Tax=Clostridium faecium TaxID=2762223 RepID=A0ABR8YNQ5_9CLOT|nr:hypothetical protein [Clostridium faecium]MBD8045843.1 hypothetical protein [Clostridium faecium]
MGNGVTIIGEITDLSDEVIKNITSPSYRNYSSCFTHHDKNLLLIDNMLKLSIFNESNLERRG